MSQIYESGTRQTDYYDRKIGFNLRTIRLLKGMTQEDLSQRIGVTYQQVQKLESGSNRIGAGRLYKLSLALECNVEDFFEGLDKVNQPGNIWQEILSIHDTKILHAYQAIRSQKVREVVLSLMIKLADAED